MSSQPTTISDPSQNSTNQKSDRDIIIALTVLFGTGVVCIACACYVNIRRRGRLAQECTHMAQNGADLEAQRTNVNMAERSSRHRRYLLGGQPNADGQSQTALTARAPSAQDWRCSMNSSMMSDYGRSPAGSTFGVQAHGLQGDDDESTVEPPPRYEMAVREPPAVHLDGASARSGSVTPTVVGAVAGVPVVVVRGEEDEDEDEDLYRSPTPPTRSNVSTSNR